MAKIPPLYIKNNKGRYERFQVPELDVSKTYYQRINGKYEPVSILQAKELPEGVWVVTRHQSCREYISGRYLRECFHLDKAADIEKISLAKMGHINKVVGRIIDELHLDNSDTRPMTNHELIKAVVGLVYKYNEEV